METFGVNMPPPVERTPQSGYMQRPLQEELKPLSKSLLPVLKKRGLIEKFRHCGLFPDPRAVTENDIIATLPELATLDNILFHQLFPNVYLTSDQAPNPHADIEQHHIFENLLIELQQLHISIDPQASHQELVDTYLQYHTMTALQYAESLLQPVVLQHQNLQLPEIFGLFDIILQYPEQFTDEQRAFFWDKVRNEVNRARAMEIQSGKKTLFFPTQPLSALWSEFQQTNKSTIRHSVSLVTFTPQHIEPVRLGVLEGETQKGPVERETEELATLLTNHGMAYIHGVLETGGGFETCGGIVLGNSYFGEQNLLNFAPRVAFARESFDPNLQRFIKSPIQDDKKGEDPQKPSMLLNHRYIVTIKPFQPHITEQQIQKPKKYFFGLVEFGHEDVITRHVWKEIGGFKPDPQNALQLDIFVPVKSGRKGGYYNLTCVFPRSVTIQGSEIRIEEKVNKLLFPKDTAQPDLLDCAEMLIHKIYPILPKRIENFTPEEILHRDWRDPTLPRDRYIKPIPYNKLHEQYWVR